MLETGIEMKRLIRKTVEAPLLGPKDSAKVFIFISNGLPWHGPCNWKVNWSTVFKILTMSFPTTLQVLKQSMSDEHPILMCIRL